MADELKQLGFAEFAAQLIGEVFEAVSSSRADQERSLTELSEAADLSSEDFARRYVSDEDADAELARLFPPSAANRLHDLETNAPYSPEKANDSESPPVEKLLGLKLRRADYVVKRNGHARLKRSATAQSREAVRQRLAVRRQTELIQMLEQGVPRVLVDSGSISAKLVFSTTTVSETEGRENALGLIQPLRPLGNVRRTLPGQDIRLIVKPASDTAPQNTTLQSDVFGEVKITFKTVT